MKDFSSIGHFINQPANPTEFETLRFEEIQKPNAGDIYKHAFYKIFWVEAGECKQTIDYREYEIAPNSLLFVSPNQVQRFDAWESLKGGVILFTEDFFLLNHYHKNRLFELSFLDNSAQNSCLNLEESEFDEFKLTIELIFKEQKRPDRNAYITQSLLHILMEQVQRFVHKRSENIMSKRCLILFKEFKTLLEKHYKENQSVSFYADKLYVTQHRLNEVSKSATGKKASDVIKTRSILEAKRLLTFSDLTVSEIASELNYFDSSYFSKVFKSLEKTSPLMFKSKMHEKYRR